MVLAQAAACDQDPVSGLVALMDEAKAVGGLAAVGKSPARTIIYCVWDAEEPGLIGSTEWVEQHQRELIDKTVAYINSDENGRGFVRLGGSHTLESFYNQVGSAVTDPETGVDVITRQRAAIAVYGDEGDRTELAGHKGLRLGALGSGSDFSPFLQHLGIASANLGFGGENPGGSYHTLYDTYEHFVRFDDPGFHYGRTLAELAGRHGVQASRIAHGRAGQPCGSPMPKYCHSGFQTWPKPCSYMRRNWSNWLPISAGRRSYGSGCWQKVTINWPWIRKKLSPPPDLCRMYPILILHHCKTRSVL